MSTLQNGVLPFSLLARVLLSNKAQLHRTAVRLYFSREAPTQCDEIRGGYFRRANICGNYEVSMFCDEKRHDVCTLYIDYIKVKSRLLKTFFYRSPLIFRYTFLSKGNKFKRINNNSE